MHLPALSAATTFLLATFAFPAEPMAIRSVYHYQHTFKLIAMVQQFDLDPPINSRPLVAHHLGDCNVHLTFASPSTNINTSTALLFTAAGEITNSTLVTHPSNTTQPMHVRMPPSISSPLSLDCAAEAASPNLDVAGSFTYRPESIRIKSGCWVACPALHYKGMDEDMPDGCVEVELGLQCGNAEGAAPGESVEVGCYAEGIL